MTGAPNDAAGPQRLDKWLWFARLVKSRSLAASLVTAGKIRVNRERTTKPSHPVKPGDVVTSAAQRTVRIVRVKAPGTRRGPAAEALTLFEELTPRAAEPKSLSLPEQPGLGATRHGERLQGAGRPTKKDRRQIDLLKGRGD